MNWTFRNARYLSIFLSCFVYLSPANLDLSGNRIFLMALSSAQPVQDCQKVILLVILVHLKSLAMILTVLKMISSKLVLQ